MTPSNHSTSRLIETPAQLGRGQVVLRDSDVIHVRVAQRRFACAKAASCLLAPEPGDQVLIAIEDDDAGWVLAVLRRKGERPARLTVEGDAEVAVSGQLRVSAEDLQLTGRKRLQAITQSLELSAKAADAAIDHVTAVGANLHSHFTRARSLAEHMDHVATRWVQRVKRRYQFVHESDQLRASEVDVRAQKLLSLQGKQTVMTAEEVIKIDGDQVHMG